MVVKNSSEQDTQALLRLLITGKLSTTEYSQRLAHLENSSQSHSVAPTLYRERILGLQGAEHRNPFHPGEHWNVQHQKTLRRNNPRLASSLQKQALNRAEINHLSPALPEYLPNPWLYGPHYSLAHQQHIQAASPTLAIRLQLECLRMGHNL
jgi:hypothetical protein